MPRTELTGYPSCSTPPAPGAPSSASRCCRRAGTPPRGRWRTRPAQTFLFDTTTGSTCFSDIKALISIVSSGSFWTDRSAHPGVTVSGAPIRSLDARRRPIHRVVGKFFFGATPRAGGGRPKSGKSRSASRNEHTPTISLADSSMTWIAHGTKAPPGPLGRGTAPARRSRSPPPAGAASSCTLAHLEEPVRGPRDAPAATAGRGGIDQVASSRAGRPVRN